MGANEQRAAIGPDRTWHCRHDGGPGSYDETARRVSHEELAVANVLVSEGHHVRTVAEKRGSRSPDLMACGVAVEVKSYMGLDERGGRPPIVTSVANKLLDARGQGAVAFLWGAESGLTAATARAGYQMFCEKALATGLGRTKDVRIMGKGFDLSFSPVADLRRARTALPAPVLNERKPRPMTA